MVKVTARRGIPPWEVSPADGMREAARKIMRLQLERMESHETGSLEGRDPEELHHMRVASRRLRAACRLFARDLGQARLQPLREDLRWLGQALGEVRDLDVSLGYLSAYLERAPAKDRPLLQGVIHTWEERRRRAREELQGVLGSDRYRLFKKGLHAFLERKGLAVKAAPQRSERLPCGMEACQRLTRRLDKVLAHPKRLRSHAVEDLHALRISVKRFRYTVEFFHNCFGEWQEPVLEEAVKIQDALGAFHDRQVLIYSLQKGLWDGSVEMFSPMFRSLVGLLAACRAEQRRQIKGFRKVWRRWTSPPFRRRIVKAVRLEGDRNL